MLRLSGEELCSVLLEPGTPLKVVQAQASAALGRACDLIAGNSKLTGDETAEALSLQDSDSLIAIARR